MVVAALAGVVVLVAVVSYVLYRRPRSLPKDPTGTPTKPELSPKNAHLSSGPPDSSKFGY